MQLLPDHFLFSRILFFADSGAQLLDYFPRSLDGCGMLIHIERNGSHTGVPAPAVAFANLRQVHPRFFGGPWVRPHRHLHAKTALAESYTVDRLGVQVIRDELVVTLKIL